MELMDEEHENLDKATWADKTAKASKVEAKPKAAPTLVNQKEKKKDPPMGLTKDTVVPEHDQKLTTHGGKPVVPSHRGRKKMRTNQYQT